MDWKDKVILATDKIVQGVYNESNKIIENEVMSNLPLQMTLYFNVIIFPVWVLTISILIYDKYHCYSEFTKFIFLTTITILLFVEVLRLYLGYEGNLRDKIPELAGFWMLSVLLQLPLQTFLLFNTNFKLRILDLTVQAVIYILLIFQLFFGYHALKYTSKTQANYFRILKARNESDRLKMKSL